MRSSGFWTTMARSAFRMTRRSCPFCAKKSTFLTASLPVEESKAGSVAGISSIITSGAPPPPPNPNAGGASVAADRWEAISANDRPISTNTTTTARMINSTRFMSSSPSRKFDDFTPRTMAYDGMFPTPSPALPQNRHQNLICIQNNHIEFGGGCRRRVGVTIPQQF